VELVTTAMRVDFLSDAVLLEIESRLRGVVNKGVDRNQLDSIRRNKC